MSTDGSDETTARLKHLGGVEILVLVLALGTGGLAAAYAIAMAVGAHAAGLEPPLMLLELGGILALGEGGALVVGVVLFGLAGLRYWDNGFRLDARVVAMPLAIAVIVWSVKYAHEAREAGAARHAREMAEAAEQGGSSACARSRSPATASAAMPRTAARWCGWSARRTASRTTTRSA